MVEAGREEERKERREERQPSSIIILLLVVSYSDLSLSTIPTLPKDRPMLFCFCFVLFSATEQVLTT